MTIHTAPPPTSGLEVDTARTKILMCCRPAAQDDAMGEVSHREADLGMSRMDALESVYQDILHGRWDPVGGER